MDWVAIVAQFLSFVFFERVVVLSIGALHAEDMMFYLVLR